MRRTGFMYSVFALALLGLLITIVANPLQVEGLPDQTTVSRVDETYYFLTSIEEDVPRATRIVTKRAAVAAINTVAAALEPLPDGEAAVVSAFRNGTVNGTAQPLMRDADIQAWISGMEDQAAATGYTVRITVPSVSVEPRESATIAVNATYNITLRDPVTDTRFRRTVIHDRTVELTNITDPLLLLETNGRYSHGFRTCTFPDPAEQHATGTEKHYTGQNWTAGEAVVRPANGQVTNVSGRSSKVLVVDDVCAYSDATIQDDLSDFAGVVSAASGAIAGDGSTICGDANSAGLDAYIGGASGATAIAPSSRAVMNQDQLWQNNVHTALETGCYLDDADGPTVFDRIEGRLSKTGTGAGWASLVFVPDLPSDFQDASRSAVDHVYFDDGGTSNRHLRGVSGDYPWFRIDQDHIDAWNVNALAYD